MKMSHAPLVLLMTLPPLASPAAAAQVTMTAEAVAQQARQGLKCPAPVQTRPAGQPVDDVLGVRPGMPFDLAWQTVLCSDPLLVAKVETQAGYRLATHGQKPRMGFTAAPAEAQVERSGREWAREMQDRQTARGTNRASDPVAPGQARWWVVTMGVPGREEVLFVRREEFFAQDAKPGMAAAEQALAAKFGAPHRRYAFPGEVTLEWSYDAQGAPLRGQEKCPAVAQMNGNVDLVANCGVAIGARLQATRENPGLARVLAIGLTHHARGLQVLEATEKALAQTEDARRRSEVDKAGTAPKPRL